MTITKHHISAIVITALVLLLLPLSHVFAQAEGAGLKIDNAVINLRGYGPGDTVSQSLRVTNTAAQERMFYLQVRNIVGIAENGAPQYPRDPMEDTPYELRSWIEISDEPIVIGGGEMIEVPFTVRIPEDATPGGHYGTIFLSAEPGRPDQVGAGIGFLVGANIDLRIPGEVLEEAHIREFRTDSTMYRAPEAHFSLRIANVGNVLVRPEGFVDITNMFNRTVASVRVNEDLRSVFPHSERALAFSWEGEGLAFGPYRAALTLAYGEDGRRTLTSITTFWIIPLNVVVPALLAVIVLLGGGYLALRAYIRRKLRAMGIAMPLEGRVAAQAAGGSADVELPASSQFPRLALIAAMLCAAIFFLLVALFFLFA